MKKVLIILVAAFAAFVAGLGAVMVMAGGAGVAPSGGSGKLMAKQIPAKYRAFIEAAAERCDGVSAPLLAAQIAQESAWNPTAQSPVGAQGLAQFMPGTWTSWGKDYDGDGTASPLQPADAIGSQADYMCYLHSWVADLLDAGALEGDPLKLTLAAYNAGPGTVEAVGGIPAITETQTYIDRILAGISRYSDNAGTYDAGGGPAVSPDGTSREPMAGSGKLDPSNLCQIPWAAEGQVLRCDATDALKELNKAYRAKFGDDLGITDAYRDYATQVYLKATKGYLAAKPGTSNHGWGLALDLDGLGAEGSTRHAWLRENGPRYGWDHPSWARIGGSKPEAWHWEYVGN